MKVKIGDKVYDGCKEPVMVILDDDDKANITNMPEEAYKYCQYPELPEWTENNYEKIKNWMNEV